MPNSWVCVDASLVVRLVTDPADREIQSRWERWIAAGRPLAAPTLLHYEVTNALYQYHKHGVLSGEAIHSALAAALSLPIHFYGDADLHRLALKLAQRFSLPATYDAHYLAVAEFLGGEFWTADRRLLKAVKADLAWVRHLT